MSTDFGCTRQILTEMIKINQIISLRTEYSVSLIYNPCRTVSDAMHLCLMSQWFGQFF